MYRIKFLAHNYSADWREVKTHDIDAAYQIICALNYTGFSFSVYNDKADVTEAFEDRMRNDLDLPVCKVASTLPRSVPVAPSPAQDETVPAADNGGGTSLQRSDRSADALEAAEKILDQLLHGGFDGAGVIPSHFNQTRESAYLNSCADFDAEKIEQETERDDAQGHESNPPDEEIPCYFLAFINSQGLAERVINTAWIDLTHARNRLSDRIANGESFPGEYVAYGTINEWMPVSRWKSV